MAGINFKDELIKLVELQKIDGQIYSFSQAKEVELPKKLQDLKDAFELRKKEVTGASEEVKQAMLKKKDKELEMASKEENVVKAQAQLYQLKNNKEYQAKMSEIASMKADISLLEESIIKLIDAVEAAEKKAKEKQDIFTAEQSKFSQEETKIKNDINEVAIQSKILEDRRVGLVRDVDPEILIKYDKLIKSRSGYAIAPVVNGSCGACNIRASHQVINEIKMYKSLVLCGNCVRILYIPEDFGLDASREKSEGNVESTH
jgi:uncharacterized protein